MTDIALVWVESYRSAGSLDCSEEAACGFAKALAGTVVLNFGDANAFDKLLEGPKPPVEAAQILYYAGHGDIEGPRFDVSNKDDGVAHPDNMRLGRRLVMAVFDSCATLKDAGRWNKVFQGLRYLVGFTQSVFESKIRGALFANYLRQGYTVQKAWEQATLDTECTYAPCLVLCTPDSNGEAVDEPWPEAGIPLGGPRQPSFFMLRTEVLEDLLPGVVTEVPKDLASDSARSELKPVGLFRLLPTNTEELGKRSGAPFDLHFMQGRQTSAGLEWIAASRRFEVLSASGSFRWSRRRQSARAPFEEPALVPLPPAEAMAAANRFLGGLGFLDDRVYLNSISATHEVHQTRDADRRMDRTVARHVQYKFSMAGLPIFGSGAKMRVTFEGSEVDGFLRYWREPVREGSVEVISAEDAELRLRTSKAFRHLPSTAIKVGSKKLGYLALPPMLPQEYLLPVYAIQGEVVTSVMRYDFVRYVPATADEAELPPGLSAQLTDLYRSV